MPNTHIFITEDRKDSKKMLHTQTFLYQRTDKTVKKCHTNIFIVEDRQDSKEMPHSQTFLYQRTDKTVKKCHTQIFYDRKQTRQ